MSRIPGGENVTYENCTTWAKFIELCGSFDQYLSLLDQALKIENTREVGLFDGAKQGVDHLHDAGVEIHIVTHREPQAAPDTIAFLLEQGIRYHAFICDPDISKAQYCIDNGIDVLIDDSPEVLEDATSKGLRCFSLEFHYNRDVIAEHGVTSAAHWNDLTPLIAEAVLLPKLPELA